MFSNVKSQIGGIGGWLGSSIPKLRKGEDPEYQEEKPHLIEDVGPTADSGIKNTREADDDDNSRYNHIFHIVVKKVSSFNILALLVVQIPGHNPLQKHQWMKKIVNLEMVNLHQRCEIKTLPHFFLVQSKAIAGAKSFGNFLYSAVNKAGKTVSEASAKIKRTVEDNVCLLK